MRNLPIRSFRLFGLAWAFLALSFPAFGQQTTLRVGYFPNITHAQALVASQLTSLGKGWFETQLGGGIKLQWFPYNAGPSAMEALAADSIDLTYVGPSPALNLYVKAGGEEVRIIAGSATGGAALVVQGDGGINKPEDFRGKSIATPQLGNTQDVACRAWLKKQGFRVTQLGGDVRVLPTANPDQLALFANKKLDGVWTVEPWVSRLELDAQGRVFLEQKDAIATVLVSSAKLLKEKPGLVKKFAAAHAALTAWVNSDPADAKTLANAQLKEVTKREMPAALVERSWGRLHFTSDFDRNVIEASVADAQSVGFLKGPVDLSVSWPSPMSNLLDEHIPLASAQPPRHDLGMNGVSQELEVIKPLKLSISGVSKWFREGVVKTHALDNVSLDVDESEFVCLVGPSGCGKSTLLNMIAGLEFPDDGKIMADGRVITEPGRDRMMMFQESALFPWLNVLGNVLFGLKLKPNLTNKEREEVAQFYIKLVGLERYAQSNIHELSGGMRQRVALARSLAPNPRVLLMDEPFAALDAMTREQLYGDLQEIWAARKKTIVFVTHNVREAACLGDRVILFSPHPGRIREQFKIDLPRPRDINSPSLAEYSTRITRALKSHQTMDRPVAD